MAKITVYASVWSSDPGIVNMSSYEGSIDAADVQSEQNLKSIVTSQWWREDVAYKFAPLYLKELREDGAVFTYGLREVVVPFGKTQSLEEVGLSYAYGDIAVRIDQ